MGREEIPAVNQGDAMRWRVSLGPVFTVVRPDLEPSGTITHGSKNAVEAGFGADFQLLQFRLCIIRPVRARSGGLPKCPTLRQTVALEDAAPVPHQTGLLAGKQRGAGRERQTRPDCGHLFGQGPSARSVRGQGGATSVQHFAGSESGQAVKNTGSLNTSAPLPLRSFDPAHEWGIADRGA